MGENKRYVYIEHKNADYILEDPNYELDFIEMLGNCLEPQEIVDKLNKLSDKNEQLKKDIEFSDRKQNDFFKNWNDSMNENFRLKQENEQLKEKNKKLRHDLNVLRRGVFGGF